MDETAKYITFLTPIVVALK